MDGSGSILSARGQLLHLSRPRGSLAKVPKELDPHLRQPSQLDFVNVDATDLSVGQTPEMLDGTT